MRRLIEEYGTVILYVITGIICIVLFRAAFFGNGSSVAKVVNSSLETSTNQDISIQYTITYDGMDGAVFTGDVPTTYTREDRIFLPIPEKAGYLFAGWVGSRISEPTINVVIPEGSTGNRTYTATWTKGYYRVIFDSNLGYYQDLYSDTSKGAVSTAINKNLVAEWMDGKSTSNLYEYGIYPTIPSASTFSFKGHKFTGWSTTKDGSGTTYKAGTSCTDDLITAGTASWTIDEITLYAQWETVNYTINYSHAYNIGVAEFDEDRTPANYRIIDTLKPYITDETTGYKSAKLTGYDFAGWYLKDPYLDYAYENIEDYRLGGNENPDTIMPGTIGDITLWAKWVPRKFNITYDINLPTCELKLEENKEANACVILEDIKNSKDEVIKSKEDKIGNSDLLKDNVKVTYKSTYKDALPEIYIAPANSETGKPSITRKYKFNGWCLDSACSIPVEETTEVTTPEDHKLYANWTPIKYNIVLHSNYSTKKN